MDKTNGASKKESASGGHGNARRAGAPGAATVETRGVALALLRDFYWIELGIRSYLRACGNPEFSRGDGMVIANITLGYNRPSDIARQLGVSRQTIHRQIHQMREKGIVALENDPTDGRIKLVTITDLARKMNDDGVVAMSILWEELAGRLGVADLERAAKVLTADWGPPISFGQPADGPRA
jgi:DNA-binding MarR family transcriptional regulator